MSKKRSDRRKRTSYQKQSDAGDIAKKFMQGLAYIHKIGGVGLDLIAIGGVILFFLFLIRSTFDFITFIIGIFISLFLIIIGAIILLKEKKII